jgi:hypothetical protein
MEDDVKSTDAKGQTALHVASQSNQTLSTARRLLSKGADVDAKDKQGWTPLHIASFYGADRIVDLLLAEGANPMTVTRAGDTAYLIALAKNHRTLLPRLRHGLIAPGDYTVQDTSTASSLAVPEASLGPPATSDAPRERSTGPLGPRTPADSALFPRLTGVGRKTRKHGSSRIRRYRRGRLSRRKIKA